MEVEVLACNWETVDVFLRCQQTIASGMSACFLGISCSEVRAALELGEVPRRRWRRISAGVQQMGRIAASVLNTKKG